MKAKKAFDSHTTKIVIAEDELLVRVGLKSIIPWEKYNLELVSEFFNGDELLQYIRKYPPHILLLDIKLPGSSGLDILKIIHDENLPIQVIVISSWDDCYTMKQAMQLGAYEYIHKPQMTSTQLLEMILKIQAQLLHDNIRSNSRICKDKNSLIDFNIENWLSVKCANSFVLIYFTVHKNDKMENITTQKTVTSFIQEFISAKKEILLVSYMQNGCTLSVFSNDVSEHNFFKKKFLCLLIL